MEGTLKMSKRLLEKLEKYEQDAYDGEFGDAWLADVGEGFKFYIQDCVTKGKRPTIKGFEKYLDKKHAENFVNK
jgi:hypothetical protein